MIRVVYCVDGFEAAGTELNTVRWAERLDRTRFDLRVVCMSERGSLLRRYHEMGIPVVPLHVRSFVRPPPIGPALKLRRYLRNERIAVFHAHGVYDNIFGVPVARWAGVPLVLASRRWWKAPVRRSFGPLNRWSYRFAHGVLANSRSVADILRIEDGVPDARIHTVSNFVEDEAFSEPPTDWKNEQRRALGLAEGLKVVGKLARLRPEKDHATLLRAFATLTTTREGWRLVLAGDGPEETRLRELARTLGIAEYVHFAGKQPSRPSYHSLFDISVLSSTSEGFPNSLLEAMAQARPLVASRVGGVPDAVTHERNGYLVAPGDVEGFAARLDALMSDASLRETMGAQSATMARAFSEEETMRRLHALYAGATEGMN